MNFNPLLIGLATASLCGCSILNHTPEPTTKPRAKGVISGTLAPDSWSFVSSDLPSSAIRQLDVSSQSTLEWICEDQLPLTSEFLLSFFKDHLSETSTSGVLLQKGHFVLAFIPQSPVFHAWELSGDLMDWELLLEQVGRAYPYLSSEMTTDFFKDGFASTPSLQAQFLGTGYISDGVSFEPASRSINLETLQTSLEDQFGSRLLTLELNNHQLQLQLQLTAEDLQTEEAVRAFLKHALVTLVQQSDSQLLQHVSIEVLTSGEDWQQSTGYFKTPIEVPYLPLAQVDLSVHDLFNRRWEGELTHALGEPLTYFRYYGVPEYE